MCEVGFDTQFNIVSQGSILVKVVVGHNRHDINIDKNGCYVIRFKGKKNEEGKYIEAENEVRKLMMINTPN